METSRYIARNWWAVALRGAAAIVFGILTFVWPEASLTSLILLFGAYATVDGIFAIVSAIANRKQANGERPWWASLIGGICGIVIGTMTFVWPTVTALALVYFVAGWALLTGLVEIAAAIELRKLIQGEWVLILSGVVSLIFAVLLISQPRIGALAVLWMIGCYALAFGGLLVTLGFKLKSASHAHLAAAS